MYYFKILNLEISSLVDDIKRQLRSTQNAAIVTIVLEFLDDQFDPKKWMLIKTNIIKWKKGFSLRKLDIRPANINYKSKRLT